MQLPLLSCDTIVFWEKASKGDLIFTYCIFFQNEPSRGNMININFKSEYIFKYSTNLWQFFYIKIFASQECDQVVFIFLPAAIHLRPLDVRLLQVSSPSRGLGSPQELVGLSTRFPQLFHLTVPSNNKNSWAVRVFSEKNRYLVLVPLKFQSTERMLLVYNIGPWLSRTNTAYCTYVGTICTILGCGYIIPCNYYKNQR